MLTQVFRCDYLYLAGLLLWQSMGTETCSYDVDDGSTRCGASEA